MPILRKLFFVTFLKIITVKSTMARITVEDCLRRIPNPFDLILVASMRARQIMKGLESKTNSHHKSAVMALHEIASGQIGIEILQKAPI